MTEQDIQQLLREVLQRVERGTPKRRYTPDERRALGVTRARLRAQKRDEELAYLESALTAIVDSLEET